MGGRRRYRDDSGSGHETPRSVVVIQKTKEVPNDEAAAAIGGKIKGMSVIEMRQMIAVAKAGEFEGTASHTRY